MDLDELKDLIELLKETDITELQLEREGAKIKIKREKFESVSAHRPAGVSSIESERTIEKEVPQADETLAAISSPIVGIFHRSPAPEAPPFVEVGSIVKKGQVLCIVEAMKLMNEIESDRDGTITKILVENGNPVEYGESLFLIDPA